MHAHNQSNSLARKGYRSRPARGGRTLPVTLAWVAVFALAVAASVFLAGCEPTAEYGGKRLSEGEVAVLVERENAKAIADAQAEAARLEREAAERTRAFQRALDRLIAEQGFAREELADLYDRDIADIRAKTEQVAAAAKAAVDERLAAQAAHKAEIEKQWATRETIAGWLDTGESLASGVPGVGPIVGVLGTFGGLAGLFGMRRKSQQANELAAQRANAEARANQIREALRAVAAGVAQLPRDKRDIVKALIGAQADNADRAIIADIVREDDLYELEVAADAKP